ncbi:MAG: hypothetical protein ACXAD7_24280 [Candidatus Kariarchaeaceae archaeon]|jgi:hypothetical protein
MTAVKIDRQDMIDELLARIYLDTKIKLNKKNLLELIFDMSYQNYDNLIKVILESNVKDSIRLRKSFIENFSGKLKSDDEDFDPKSIWVSDVEE